MRHSVRRHSVRFSICRARCIASTALGVLCLFAAPLPVMGAASGAYPTRATDTASARVREEAGRTALRHWQEGRRRAAAHARMSDTMYASTPDPAVPDHPFPIHQAIRHDPLVVAKSHSAEGGEVRVEAVDDEGTPADPVTLSVGASQAIHLNSQDLEGGSADKGLPDGIGPGQGDWRLALSSALDIEVLAYIRTKDGFVTSMHDLAPAAADGLLHRVAFFNPGSNYRQASHLLLVNRGNEDAETTIEGIDDGGLSPGTTVRVQVPAGKAVSLASKALEEGGDGFEGALGDGKGKWRLWVTLDQPLLVASLLDTPTATWPTSPRRRAGARPGRTPRPRRSARWPRRSCSRSA